MITLNKFTIILLTLCVCLFSKCSESEDGQPEATEDVTEEVTEKTPERKVKITPYMFVQHRVADFQVWKKGFDEHASVRRAYGMKVLNVFRLKEDTNHVIFIMEVNDFKAAYKYAASPELEETMNSLGVIGDPVIKMLNATQYPAEQEKTTFMFIQHRVEDYKIWKKGFDKHARSRQKHGLYALNVFSLDGNSNNVLILMEIESFKAAKKYVISQALRNTMEELGVSSDIEVTLVTSVQ